MILLQSQWNLSKISPKFFKSSFCFKKKGQQGLVLLERLLRFWQSPISQRHFFFTFLTSFYFFFFVYRELCDRLARGLVQILLLLQSFTTSTRVWFRKSDISDCLKYQKVTVSALHTAQAGQGGPRHYCTDTPRKIDWHHNFKNRA